MQRERKKTLQKRRKAHVKHDARIANRKRLEEDLEERNIQQATLTAILEGFTRSIDLKEILEESVKQIKDYAQCSSVGIRLLDDHGNIPYEAYVGFPTEFYESESPLSIKSDKCMCINVIKGDYDPSKPFFTAGGSFYANGTSKLLATVSEEQKGETRNICNKFGYESVALVPIRLGDRIIGLIHIADQKEDTVPLQTVQFMEKVAAEISLGIDKARISSELRESEQKLRRHSQHLEQLVAERTRELRESEEKFRGFVERSFDIVATLDLEGRISYVSPAVLLLTGYSPEEMMGKSLQNYLTEGSILKATRGLARVAKGEIAGAEEFEIVRKDGSITQVEVNASPVLKDGKILGVQAIIRDVSEKFKLMEMRDRFISAVTHELRTPLVSVKGYVDYILSGKLGSVAEKIESSLKVVKRSTDVLVQLVNDLLDIQRLAMGRLELNKEPLDLRKLVEDCIENTKHLLEQNARALKLEAPEGELTVLADRIRISQVVMNILDNAVKFTPRGGQIIIRVYADEEQAKVQISDTGIGIRKEDLEKVFIPFAAIKKPTYFKGTGLGLSVGKGLIEAHGGKMWVESPGEGKGATLAFTLPRRKEAS